MYCTTFTKVYKIRSVIHLYYILIYFKFTHNLSLLYIYIHHTYLFKRFTSTKPGNQCKSYPFLNRRYTMQYVGWENHCCTDLLALFLHLFLTLIPSYHQYISMGLIIELLMIIYEIRTGK